MEETTPEAHAGGAQDGKSHRIQKNPDRRLRDDKQRVAVPRASGTNPSGAQAARVRPHAVGWVRIFSPLPAVQKSWPPWSGAWAVANSIRWQPSHPPPIPLTVGGVGSAGQSVWADRMDALQRRGMLGHFYRIQSPVCPMSIVPMHQDSSAAYRVRPNLRGIGAGADSRFCTRDGEARAVGSPLGLGRRPDWCALQRLDDDESRPRGPARHAILRGKRAPSAPFGWLRMDPG